MMMMMMMMMMMDEDEEEVHFIADTDTIDDYILLLKAFFLMFLLVHCDRQTDGRPDRHRNIEMRGCIYKHNRSDKRTLVKSDQSSLSIIATIVPGYRALPHERGK